MKYCCVDCLEEIKIKTKPNFCPYCGSQKLQLMSKQRETALKLIAELENLKEEHNRILSDYAEIRAEIEYRAVSLRQYKKRGVISADELPVFEKPKINEYLKEYREKRKTEKMTNTE